MANNWTFVLEIKPIAKGRPRFGKGFAYTPSKTRQYENEVAQLLKKQYWGLPLKGPISVAITFLFERPKKPKHSVWHIVKPDADNLTKGVCDSANGIIWEDDAQVCELRVFKKYAPEGRAPQIILQVALLDSSH